ncbi:dihydrodipicolinate reductase [soil metagenome]
MAYRVVQWSTGNVGRMALRAIIEHPDLTLVGVHAHDPDKVGRDAAELCDLTTPTGVVATNDVDALLALRPDCVNYSTLNRNLDDLCRILAAGINVVGTARFITGEHIGTNSQRRLEDACREGESSLYGSGMNPGTSNVLALVASGLCDRIHSISVTESVDVTDYASRETWEGIGWAQPLGAPGQVAGQEYGTTELREAMEMTAEALGIELDEVRYDIEYGVIQQDIVLPYMTFPKGTVAGQRSTYHGMRNGRSVVRQHVVYRVRGDIQPEFPVIDGYLMEIEGEPSVSVVLNLPKPKVPGVNRERNAMASGMVATAMAAINAIPAVCRAPAGIRKAYELPVVTARGLAVD